MEQYLHSFFWSLFLIIHLPIYVGQKYIFILQTAVKRIFSISKHHDFLFPDVTVSKENSAHGRLQHISVHCRGAFFPFSVLKRLSSCLQLASILIERDYDPEIYSAVLYYSTCCSQQKLMTRPVVGLRNNLQVDQLENIALTRIHTERRCKDGLCCS